MTRGQTRRWWEGETVTTPELGEQGCLHKVEQESCAKTGSEWTLTIQ